MEEKLNVLEAKIEWLTSFMIMLSSGVHGKEPIEQLIDDVNKLTRLQVKIREHNKD